MITFFKDITFGVLYEQIKAQQELKNMVNNTLYQKIGVPLQTIIRNCKNLEASRELQLFERYQLKNCSLKSQLTGTIILCKQVVLRLKDMQDWSALLNGTFVSKNINFNFESKLKEIIQGMRMKANYNNVVLSADYIFKSKKNFS